MTSEMKTVHIKCRYGEKISWGSQEYLTIDQVELLFVDSNLNSEKNLVDYPKLTSIKRFNGSENRNKCDFEPQFTNIEIEKINQQLGQLLQKASNVITYDKTTEIFLQHFADLETNFIPIGYTS